MRHSKIIVFLVFALAAIWMVGCADNNNRSQNQRSRISNTKSRPTNTGAEPAGTPASAAALAEFRELGVGVQTSQPESITPEQVDQVLTQKFSGSQIITIQDLAVGTYQLEEVIQVMRVMDSSQASLAAKNKTPGGAAARSGVHVMGHSVKVIVDNKGVVSLSALQPFGNSLPQNFKPMIFNLPVQFEVQQNDILVKSALSYTTQIEKGKRTTQAMQSPPESPNVISDLKLAAAQRRIQGKSYLVSNAQGAPAITLRNLGDRLFVGVDAQPTSQNGRQGIKASLYIFKKITAGATAEGSAASSTVGAKAQDGAAHSAPTNGSPATTPAIAPAPAAQNPATTSTNPLPASAAPSANSDPVEPQLGEPVVSGIKN